MKLISIKEVKGFLQYLDLQETIQIIWVFLGYYFGENSVTNTDALLSYWNFVELTKLSHQYLPTDAFKSYVLTQCFIIFSYFSYC